MDHLAGKTRRGGWTDACEFSANGILLGSMLSVVVLLGSGGGGGGGGIDGAVALLYMFVLKVDERI